MHEGPQRINKTCDLPFEVGNVSSCEPGVYFEGNFGVRLENVIATVHAGDSVFGEFYRFDTFALCPFDRNLIDVTLLTDDEVVWLNAYTRGFERRWARGCRMTFEGGWRSVRGRSGVRERL